MKWKNVETIGIVISIIIMCCLVVLQSTSAQDVRYNGDTVYIDDSNVYLSATPSTLHSSGNVVFELISKRYSGSIDIIFGFNKDVCKPKSLDVMNNGSDTWISKSVNVEPIQHLYNNMTTWYILSDINIQSNKLYKARVWLEIEFAGLNRTEGEYYFAVKPSGETIQQAIDNGHFYYLDPWWDATWSNRIPITIKHDYFATCVNNFPIGVNLTATVTGDCQANGNDLRFTLDDNATLLNYEIETFTQGGASLVWVNVTYISNTIDTLIWCYYNNPGAAYGANPYGTWEGNYLAVWHCTNAYQLYDSTKHNKNMSYIDAGTNTTGIYGTGAIAFDGANDYYASVNIVNMSNQPFMLECWINQGARTAAYRYYLNKAKGGATARITWFSPTNAQAYDIRGDYLDTGDCGIYFLTGNSGYAFNSWWKYATMRKVSTTQGIMQMDRNIIEVDSGPIGGDGTVDNVDNGGDILSIGAYYDGTLKFDGKLDEIRISTNTSRNDTWRNATFNNWNASDFITFGTEETLLTFYITWTLDNPVNGTEVCPCCFCINFTITQNFGYMMNITVWSNCSGFWKIIGNITRVYNGTYGLCIDDMDNLNKIYYWNATIDDGTRFNTTYVYDILTYSNISQCYPEGGGSSPSYAWTIALSIFGIISFILIMSRWKWY